MESSSRSRVGTPVPAEVKRSRTRPQAKRPTARKLTRATPSSVINIDLTTRALSFTPEHYRTMAPEQLEEEISNLRAVRDSMSGSSPERDNISGLIDSLETRISTGVMAEDLISEITTTVATIRGFQVKDPLKFKLLDRTQLAKLLDEKLEADLPPNYLPNLEFTLKLLGAIPQRVDLKRTIVSLLSEQIAGLYDKDTKTLYVMKQFDLNRALGRIILAHEICHALQDQVFDFNTMPLEQSDNDDANTAMLSVIEGDATILMQEYAQDVFTGKDILQFVDILTIDQSALNKAPHYLRESLTFPYLTGAAFLSKISYMDPDLRNQAFKRHPESTEQIMHPEKYNTTDYDAPTSISTPDLTAVLGAGWKRINTNVFGELQTKLLFENWREWNQATVVSEGWDGDRYDVYRNGDKFHFYWFSTWDSEQDAGQFFDGLSKLFRDKRYKSYFADVDFSTTGTRVMEHAADSPLFIALSLEQAHVEIHMSNSREAFDTCRSPENRPQVQLAKNRIDLRIPVKEAAVDADTGSTATETTAPVVR